MSLNTVCKDLVKQKNLIVRKSTQSHTSPHERWSGNRGFGIWNSAQGIKNPSKLLCRIQNPGSTDKESGIQYLGSGIFSVEFRIQDCLGLPYMEQFTKIPKFDDNWAKFILNKIQPFKSLKVVWTVAVYFLVNFRDFEQQSFICGGFTLRSNPLSFYMYNTIFGRKGTPFVNFRLTHSPHFDCCIPLKNISLFRPWREISYLCAAM